VVAGLQGQEKENGDILIESIQGSDQLADILTKSVEAEKFRKITRSIFGGELGEK
jgi:hypothetical protein